MVLTIEKLKSITPELRWAPIVGEETTDFRVRKSQEAGGPNDEALEKIIFEAQTILGRCVSPTAPTGNETGLVVGYVQSGKTLSFTTVMALARDNGFQFIILIAGTGTNLKSQSEKRLAKDLGFDGGARKWTHFQNPDPNKSDRANIQNALQLWSNEKVPAHKRRAVLVTVLKQHQRLENLVQVIRELNLERVPTLIIDDEGDQASLNSKAARNKKTGGVAKSVTYDWITEIKSIIPHHTFIQYTATPQANLLISFADVLTPSFAELVTPGDGYVGGQEIFRSHPPLVATIPIADVPSTQNILRYAPASLLSALRFFLLGAAVHTIEKQKGTRSMMVHPSRVTGPHGDYRRWVAETFENWKDLLNLDKSEPAYSACANLFVPEYNSLKQSFPAIPEFAALIEEMPSVFLTTSIAEVNRTQGGEADIRWEMSDYWILVGGQKLDRGFTVEGLTVTYMPRPAGTGNADTIQQRARFFGYKKNYQGLCRIFLIQAVRDVFTEYVEHEEFIRNELIRFRGRPLMDWKRDFLLSSTMNPTRKSVIGISIRHIALNTSWKSPNSFFKNPILVEQNRVLLGRLTTEWKATYGFENAGVCPEFRDDRPNSPQNILIRDIPVMEILRSFLLKVGIPDEKDSENHTAWIIAISKRLEDFPDDLGDVFLIADLSTSNQNRTVVEKKINQVFQGDQTNYVGDRALFNPNRLTLHLRMFNFTLPPGVNWSSQNVPWFSIKLTDSYLYDSVVQER